MPAPETFHVQSLRPARSHQWPVYVVYVLSFLQVSVVWFNHHTMFHCIRRSEEDRRIASQLYSGTLAINGLFFNAMWRHALRGPSMRGSA